MFTMYALSICEIKRFSYWLRISATVNSNNIYFSPKRHVLTAGVCDWKKVRCQDSNDAYVRDFVCYTYNRISQIILYGGLQQVISLNPCFKLYNSWLGTFGDNTVRGEGLGRRLVQFGYLVHVHLVKHDFKTFFPRCTAR